MNKKGFTTVELLLTMVLVVIIMSTITSVTNVYNDRNNYEEILTEVTDYKNTLTKIIYDDILNPADQVIAIEQSDNNNYKLVTISNRKIDLNIYNEGDNIGIKYDDVNYNIPGSNEGLVSFEGVNFRPDDENKLYSLDIIFNHRSLDKTFRIHLAISEGMPISITHSLENSIKKSTCNPTLEEDGIVYLSGSNDCIDFNYVWYSGKLWRITAIYPDGSLKMITEDILTRIGWGRKGNSFHDSYVYHWLNEEFKDTLYNEENIIVQDAKWNVTATADPSSKIPETDIETNAIGLLNTYEYILSKKNTLFDSFISQSNAAAWTLTKNFENRVFGFPGSAGNFNAVEMDEVLSRRIGIGAVRPVIYLKPSVTFISGQGKIDDPYKISEDLPKPNYNSTKLTERVSGEYVKFDNKLFRIINVENNSTKLVSVDYIRDSSGNVVTKQFSNSNIFGGGSSNSYWDYYLNNDWYNNLNPTYKSMMVKGTYYLGQIGWYSTEMQNTNYKQAICSDFNTSLATKDCPKVSSTWNGYVGLPRNGELFAAIMPTSNISLFLITPNSTQVLCFYVPDNAADGHSPWLAYHYENLAVRPTINLSPNVVITAGDGTSNNPFEIKMG